MIRVTALQPARAPWSQANRSPKAAASIGSASLITVAGRLYVPEENINYTAVGLASWYGNDFHGRYTANGEIFDMNSISAAHPTLPLPSYARVTNLANQSLHHRSGQ